MARLIVGDDENASYAKPSGGAFGSKPFVLWPQRSGGTRYTDLLYVDNSVAGSGTVNGTTYSGGVLLTGSVDGAFGAQLPDGLDVPGVWVEFDGRPARVFLHARQADGTEPLSAQASAAAAVAAEVTARQAADIAVQNAAAADATGKVNAIKPTDGAVAVSAAQAVAASGATFVARPAGGSDGQALVKSGTAAAWATVASSGLVVTDNGDGTFDIAGSGVTDNGDGTYTISAA